MERKYYEMIEANPVIVAVKDEQGLRKCCESEDLKVAFILFGDICNIATIVDLIKRSGKLALVHVDLISGLGAKEIAVDFIKKNTKADGIISTKPNLVRRAKELGMLTVFRFFVLDSLSLQNLERQLRTTKSDVIEILPGVMPKIIRRICSMTKTPVIAGGLISDKEDILAALDAGAVAISSTNQSIWEM